MLLCVDTVFETTEGVEALARKAIAPRAEAPALPQDVLSTVEFEAYLREVSLVQVEP